jgi:hypothetical protein
VDELKAMDAAAQPVPGSAEALAAYQEISDEIREAEEAAPPSVVDEVNAALAVAGEGFSDTPSNGGGRASKKQMDGIARRFAELGWPPREYLADVLKACTAFTGRPITSAADLTVNEATALAAELGKIIRTHDEDHYIVVLADKVGEWTERQEAEQ